MAEEKRVHVWTGDMVEYLGVGTLVGYVRTYGVDMGERIITFPNPEEPISKEYLAEVGGELVEDEANPKIVLDDGRTVYGMQVHWYEDE